ncbi:MAG: PDZ domain-containing protein [Saprospiraceae bacterium]|nr:PDZ domain-containing protein [Saprospiraceae bacterium]
MKNVLLMACIMMLAITISMAQTCQPSTTCAKPSSEKSTSMVKIAAVIPGSAAAKAGLQAQDVITTVNEQIITSQVQLRTILSEKKPGDYIRLQYQRDGKYYDTNVKLGQQAEKTDFWNIFSASNAPAYLGVQLTDGNTCSPSAGSCANICSKKES